MPRDSLLRHLFKHGLHAKSRSCEQPPKLNESARPATITSKTYSRPLSPPRTPESPSVHVLPQITEEVFASTPTSPSPTSSSIGSTVSSLASVPTVLAAPVLLPAPAIDPATLATRDLVYAAIDEATAATNAHIDTLETTLSLLQAIKGFSDTVEVLEGEMQDKKRACRTRLMELEGFEEAIDGMRLPDDELHVRQG